MLSGRLSLYRPGELGNDSAGQLEGLEFGIEFEKCDRRDGGRKGGYKGRHGRGECLVAGSMAKCSKDRK